jgi:dihydroorotase
MIIYGNVFYKGRIVECGIEVENGVVVDIGKDKRGKSVDGIIMPAGIDVHVHFRDFKESYKETIESGSLSALYGGVCLVVDQPNTNPPIVDEEIYFRRMEIAERSTYVDYSLNLGLVEDNVDEIDEILKKIEEKYYVPAIGEVFLKGKMSVSYETLEKAKKTVNKLITVHAEDPNEEDDVMAEVKAVERCLKMNRFHFCHISTAKALDMIYNSESTSEVAPHHLLYSKEVVKFKVNPSLKSNEERVALVRNFYKADILSSDHAPHTLEEKWEGAPGFPGVETLYPMFFYMAKKGYIKINDLVEKFVVNPAKIFGFDRYGEIEVGNYANFVVFDPHRERPIKAKDLHSKVGWTIYEGLMAVFPKDVYIRGEKVLEDGEILIDRGFGKVLQA